MPTTPIHLLGVRIDSVTAEDARDALLRFLHGMTQHQIVTVNPEFIMEAQRNRAFAGVLARSSLATADGFGLLLVARMKGMDVPSRLTGVEMTELIAALCASEGKTVFLFGGLGDVAVRTAAYLRGRSPSLVVCGAENEFDDHGAQRSMDTTLERIRSARPDVLLVALGSPKQELWIADHLMALPTVKIAMGVGGTFDYLAGEIRRAPRILRRMGFEWLWRLFLEPRRRWQRIVTAVVRFPLAVMRGRA